MMEMMGHQELMGLVLQANRVLQVQEVFLLLEHPVWPVLHTTLAALAALVRREEQEILGKREESEPPDLLGAQEILGVSDPQVLLGRLEAQV